MLNILRLSLVPLLLVPGLLSAQEPEPEFNGRNAQELITRNSLDGWQVPSNRWSVSGKVIKGTTNGRKIDQPEWIYTDGEYDDFIFSAELRLTGSEANSGIWFRANIFDYSRRGETYEAPSGYEYDAVINSGLNASIGDFFARSNLRIRADRNVLNGVFKPNEYNRMTIRAEGNHIEYWMNGTKVNEITDTDRNRETKGFVGFQLHNNLVVDVEVRNVYVTDLNENGSNIVTLKRRTATGSAIEGSSRAFNGADVSTSTFSANNEDQQWEEIDHNDGFFSYQKKGTNFSLDGGSGGARVQDVYLWRTNPNNFNQQWKKVSISGNIFRLVKRNASDFTINGGPDGSVNLWENRSRSKNLDWIIE